MLVRVARFSATEAWIIRREHLANSFSPDAQNPTRNRQNIKFVMKTSQIHEGVWRSLHTIMLLSKKHLP